MSSSIRWRSYPRTEPPPHFAEDIVAVFRRHEATIGTLGLPKGLKSDEVLGIIREDLRSLDFEVEAGKRKSQKILRPVFFGDNGQPTLKYEIDAYHSGWRCGLEVEAGRGWMGNAVYRDLVQAMVMVNVETLILAVANTYKYRNGGRATSSSDFDNTVAVSDALYGHSRFVLPYRLVVIGY